MDSWEVKIPADLSKKPRPRSQSPVRQPRSHVQQPRSRSVQRTWNAPPQIVCVSPKVVPNRNPEGDRLHFLDSVHIRRLFPERPVMTRKVNHVAVHHFDTCDYKSTRNKTATLDTNAFCRSIAFKDPNTNVNHVISFENFYDFSHEYEDQDPSIPVNTHYRPHMEVEKQVHMSVQIVSPQEDRQLSENKYLYTFQHKIRVYCPLAKLQTWATTFRPTEITDYCDVDPYLSASTIVNPNLLQVHYHHILHHVKLVHLVCKPQPPVVSPIPPAPASSSKTEKRDKRCLGSLPC